MSADERFRPDEVPCEVCGAPAIRLVRVRMSDGLIAGWLCDQHAQDVERSLREASGG